MSGESPSVLQESLPKRARAKRQPKASARKDAGEEEKEAKLSARQIEEAAILADLRAAVVALRKAGLAELPEDVNIEAGENGGKLGWRVVRYDGEDVLRYEPYKSSSVGGDSRSRAKRARHEKRVHRYNLNEDVGAAADTDAGAAAESELEGKEEERGLRDAVPEEADKENVRQKTGLVIEKIGCRLREASGMRVLPRQLCMAVFLHQVALALTPRILRREYVPGRALRKCEWVAEDYGAEFFATFEKVLRKAEESGVFVLPARANKYAQRYLRRFNRFEVGEDAVSITSCKDLLRAGESLVEGRAARRAEITPSVRVVLHVPPRGGRGGKQTVEKKPVLIQQRSMDALMEAVLNKVGKKKRKKNKKNKKNKKKQQQRQVRDEAASDEDSGSGGDSAEQSETWVLRTAQGVVVDQAVLDSLTNDSVVLVG